MKKKKYISVVVFFVVLALGVGIAYYIAPSTINTVLGIGSGEMSPAEDADLSAIDTASSSFSSSDTFADADNASSAVSPVEKRMEKDKNTTGSAVEGPQNNAPAEQETAAPVSQGGNSSTTEGMDEESISVSPTSPSSSTVPCSFPANVPSLMKEIIFNEIAWMGSASSSNAEWMELKNNSSDTIDLSGWELMDATGKLAVSFSGGDAIAPEGFFLLGRGSASGDLPGAKIYSGDLANAGDMLVLMDPQCGVSDYLDASAGWPAGNNTTKATMERDADGLGWHTSALPGGTPDAENSAGVPPAQYALTIAFGGDAGGASIVSDPIGLVCGASCTGSFASGTEMTLTPNPGSDAAFGGWSGICYGETVCSFAIDATTSLVADFRSTLPLPDGIVSSTPVDDATTSVPIDTSSTSPEAADHILIAAVQIAGAASDNDLVKLYNPTTSAIDMSGWKLHKRSETGTDYSLKAFPSGSLIAAAGSFTWANSGNGFSEAVAADVSSTETLSADNSVALLDAAGNVIDAVAWGTGTGQYGEGPPYPTSPGANQMLSRRSSGGVMADTDNNANDFTIQ
jgi:hypothetical protein